ncbi:hypothetical protein SAMN04488029_2131 [Reichenbachiella faecimaris]|uniref:Uncharacterized protein n=1 Tax=Reichenbachiella faecimaris TaxID=692418 RepID=A0A1W2GEB6_REIFA|nr:hypothetical protein [Reichenbachiella faecimaris]SMD34678.1 hypothetical protein SAMN04488029_2131 [Reichenbachiella faecimaris]
MIHLITVAGQSARNFYLEQSCMSDFKALMRTVTSGRVMIVSTKFRSDLFYSSEKPKHDSILKLWALYAKADLSGLRQKDICTYIGRETSFTEYFQSISRLSSNWYYYQQYQKAFYETYSNDQQNPVTMVVVGCDQHLLNHSSIQREPLLGVNQLISVELTGDTFMLAMHILKNEAHAN